VCVGEIISLPWFSKELKMTYRRTTGFVASSLYFSFARINIRWVGDADQSNTKHNHANDPLEVPIGPITRARAKKLKEALNEIVQNI
jgi:hypothetical protein